MGVRQTIRKTETDSGSETDNQRDRDRVRHFAHSSIQLTRVCLKVQEELAVFDLKQYEEEWEIPLFFEMEISAR